jgi:hypothetical protein
MRRDLPRIRKAAKNQQCVACGSWAETVVLAHLPIAGVADAGMGGKCLDLWGAWLCNHCHHEADHGEFRDDIYWRARMVYRTQCRLVEQGILK